MASPIVALPTKPTVVPTDPTTRIVEQVCAALGHRYAVEREVGRGGMALVFLARDLRDGRLVALKVIHPEVGSALGAKRFRREIALASKLEHPHIVPVLDSGAAGGLLYYVMPYLESESLRARLRRDGQLPIEEALRITRDVASALGYAHRLGIIHRDIKPENILLSGGGALVTDFGIAAAVGADDPDMFERLTATGLAVGTPAYVSPEQASGSRRLDPRTDIYSLGCVLYEMLGGETPYTGPTPQAVIAKRLHEPVPHVRALREGLPAVVEQAVTRALAKAPADRFPTAEEFVAALAPDPISGEAVAGELIPPTAVPSLPRRRATWALAMAGGVIVAAAAAALALRHSPAAPIAARHVASPDTRRVVVAVFANQTGDPSLDPLGDIIADYLARGLAETRLVEVIDARTEQPANGEVRAHGVAGARALARTVGARSVVWGAYSRAGDSLRFQAHLTDAPSGKIVGATTSAMGPVGRPTQGVEALRKRIMAVFAVRLDPQFARFEGSSQPTNYEAYREYLAGEEAVTGPCSAERDCDGEQMAHFRRAYALDSSFTLPIVRVAYLGGCVLTDSIADALRPRHDQLPAADRARLDAWVAMCHGKPRAALQAFREAMAAAPRSDFLVLRFGWFARHSGFLRETIAATEKLDRKRNERERLYWGNLTIPYHLLGEHQRELEVAQAARSTWPGDLEMLSFEARALVGLGRLDEVNVRVAEMIRIPQEAPQAHGASGWPESGGKPEDIDQIGRDLRTHGHREEARAVFERGIRWYETLPRDAQAAQRGVLALLLYDAGHWNDALPIVRELAAKYPDDIAAHWTLGAVYARLGDRRGVEKVDRWLAARKRPYLNGEHTFARARLAAILGDRDRAMMLLRQAAEEGAWLDEGGGFGPHSDPDFESLRDYPPFQELMKPRE